MRPDINDYLPSENFSDVEARIKAYVKNTTGIDSERAWKSVEGYIFGRSEFILKRSSIQLGLMFDVVYTKASLIYTKLGCFLRLTSFTSSFSVLVLFFINIIKEPNFRGSRIDIAITGILLSGAIAQELYAAWVMLSSDWAILVAEFHHNVLVRRIFKITSKYFPCLLHQSKRWSKQMGQFDLLEYCWRYKKRKANQSHGFLPKITIGSEIAEMWHKYWFTKFVKVPRFFKEPGPYYDVVSAIYSDKPLKATRGDHALKKCQQFDQLKWSIELEFDHSIIIWHLATSVCYFQQDNHHDEIMEISKHLSDYMMYLLAMRPALLLSEHSKSFWLDHAYDNLKELLFRATDDISNAASALLPNPDNVYEEELESSEETFENLKGDVLKLATFLKQSNNKWEMIRDVWTEMLFYAAFSSHHINHVKQLADGIEFLSLLWLFVGPSIMRKAFYTRLIFGRIGRRRGRTSAERGGGICCSGRPCRRSRRRHTCNKQSEDPPLLKAPRRRRETEDEERSNRKETEQQNSYLKFSNVDFPQDVAAGLSAERISLPPLWSREAAMWRRTMASKDLEIASCLMGNF
ncbi:hypothetical protein SLEP1_g23933 [Rubroshorea leprosula]|uniref:DUF4220 domain-containing protein n=1 Tax=Rubroshorea leprosula TaxID=152421 RepID=A0AAV5JN57_9ROSI|nr:hypothetical protein SLEP1_g23933 [Rubroshorea leprosula]